MVYDYIPSSRNDLKATHPISKIPGCDYFQVSDAAKNISETKADVKETNQDVVQAKDMVNYFKCDECDFVTESEEQIEAHVATHKALEIKRKPGRSKKS